MERTRIKLAAHYNPMVSIESYDTSKHPNEVRRFAAKPGEPPTPTD
jgi:hypothetical protein